jgi:hypothetical protein
MGPHKHQHGGDHFTRVSAYCGNVSYIAVRAAIDHITDALYELKGSSDTTANCNRDGGHGRGMLNFAYGFDGMFVRFEGVPHGIPAGPGWSTQLPEFLHEGNYHGHC